MQIDERLMQQIWERGRTIQGWDPTEWRQDACGAWLHRGQYNNADSDYGWRALRVGPGNPGETDSLHPFHWQNSFDVQNGKAHCRITADRIDVAPGQRVGHPRNKGK